MNKIDYRLISEAVILRDHTAGDLKYKNDEHRRLTDIADTLYNAGISADCLNDDYKALYNEYGEAYFSKILKDARAIDSQIYAPGDAQELFMEYEALLED